MRGSEASGLMDNEDASSDRSSSSKGQQHQTSAASTKRALSALLIHRCLPPPPTTTSQRAEPSSLTGQCEDKEAPSSHRAQEHIACRVAAGVAGCCACIRTWQETREASLPSVTRHLAGCVGKVAEHQHKHAQPTSARSRWTLLRSTQRPALSSRASSSSGWQCTYSANLACKEAVGSRRAHSAGVGLETIRMLADPLQGLACSNG